MALARKWGWPRPEPCSSLSDGVLLRVDKVAQRSLQVLCYRNAPARVPAREAVLRCAGRVTSQRDSFRRVRTVAAAAAALPAA